MYSERWIGGSKVESLDVCKQERLRFGVSGSDAGRDQRPMLNQLLDITRDHWQILCARAITGEETFEMMSEREYTMSKSWKSHRA